MKIMLVTRCGCTRFLEIADKYPPPFWHVALPERPRVTTNPTVGSTLPKLELRTFEYMDSSRRYGFHVYEERE